MNIIQTHKGSSTVAGEAAELEGLMEGEQQLQAAAAHAHTASSTNEARVAIAGDSFTMRQPHGGADESMSQQRTGLPGRLAFAMMARGRRDIAQVVA